MALPKTNGPREISDVWYLNNLFTRANAGLKISAPSADVTVVAHPDPTAMRKMLDSHLKATA